MRCPLVTFRGQYRVIEITDSRTIRTRRECDRRKAKNESPEHLPLKQRKLNILSDCGINS
jgi:hypothetical protein